MARTEAQRQDPEKGSYSPVIKRLSGATYSRPQLNFRFGVTSTIAESRSPRGALFVLRIFGVHLLTEFLKLLRLERARLALEHDAAKIAPRFAVFIEDHGYIGIAFNVTDFPCASLRTEVNLVLVEQRTHR